MEEAAKGLTSEQLVQLFEQAMGALWRRADLTLGDITLTAIVTRVLHNAGEKFPFFESIQVQTTGINCQQLRVGVGGANKRELIEGIEFVLTEFLGVIGNLTAEILNSSLHSELSKVAFQISPSGSTERREGNL
jgi:hypothetical protein